MAALSKLKNNIAKDISTPDHNNINLQSRTEWVYDCFCFEIHIIRIEGSFEDGATKRVVRWKPSMGRARLSLLSGWARYEISFIPTAKAFTSSPYFTSLAQLGPSSLPRFKNTNRESVHLLASGFFQGGHYVLRRGKLSCHGSTL